MANPSLKGLSTAQWIKLSQMKDYIVRSVEGRVDRDWYFAALKNLSSVMSSGDEKGGKTVDPVQKSADNIPKSVENVPKAAESAAATKSDMNNTSNNTVVSTEVNDTSVKFSVMSIPIDDGKKKDGGDKDQGSFLSPYLLGLRLLGRNNGVAASAEQSVPKWKTEAKSEEEKFSKASIDSRTRHVVTAIQEATTNASALLRVEELCRHLHQFPHAKNLAVKQGAIRRLLQMRLRTTDACVQLTLREALSLLGHCDPVKGRGVRILSIDGGGTRGMMVIEVLRKMEELTGRRVHQLFDYVCGVSTGAILAVLVGLHRRTLDEAEDLYRQIGASVFRQSPLWGTGGLVWSHSYYDTPAWEKFLRDNLGESPMITLARHPDCPKVSAVSTVVNQHNIFPFVFRTYNIPYRAQSMYEGSSGHTAWEAVRASAAAPAYFEGLKIGDYLHQDGGVMVNNPTAIAIHETKLLWPDTPVQCVVSMGTGQFQPSKVDMSVRNGDGGVGGTGMLSWKSQFYKIMDSATDTEAVHIAMNDLLPANVYFRFNPRLSDLLTLDEIRPEKLERMQEDARMYCRRNKVKVEAACELLMKARTKTQKTMDWVEERRLAMF